MDALTFLSALRRTKKDIPFIFFTETDTETIIIPTVTAGSGYYLKKTDRPADQFEWLRRLIRQAAEPGQTTNTTAEIQKHPDQMTNLINILPEAVFAVDAQGSVTVWNKAMEEMSDIPASAMLGKGPSDYSFPLYGEKRPMLIDAVLNPDPAILSYYENVHQQGTSITAETYLPEWQGNEGGYISVVALPLLDSAGNCIGALESIRDVSLRKKAETALEASEKRYKSILDEQTEFVCRFTPDWKYSYVNEAFCRYFEKNREDLIGKRFTPLMPEEERRNVDNQFHTLTPDNPTVSFREKTLGPGGGERWQHWNTRAFFDQNDQITEYQSVGRDVTEVVRTEMQLAAMQQQLQNEKERYQSILDEQTEFVCRFTPDWKYSYVNEAFCRYFEKNREDLIGKRFTPLMPEGESRKIGNQFHTLTPDNPIVSFREETLGPGGGGRWQDWNIQAFFDEQGTVVEYQSVGRDVTDMVQSEQALSLSEETYRALFEHTGSASLIIDVDTTILLVNTEFERLSGYHKDEVEGKKSWTEFVVPEDLKMMLDHHQQRLIQPDDAPGTYEFRVMDRNKNLKYIAMSIGSLPETGKTVASLVDVTENKQMQVALEEAHNKLRLLTGITRHDIVNKINALYFAIDMLQEEPPTPELTEKINLTEKIVDDIYEDIEFTRTYEKLGSTEPQWQRCELIVAGLDVSPGVSLESSLDGIEVYADLMVKIVFQNLIDNSIRHGEGVTEIRLSSVESDGSLIIRYEDNGIGVLPEMKQKIFERDVGKNTGLGLFLARDILALTGITIRETGVPGKGVRFEMTVPPDEYRILR
jgi:PAS domain S-box-containing protein